MSCATYLLIITLNCLWLFILDTTLHQRAETPISPLTIAIDFRIIRSILFSQMNDNTHPLMPLNKLPCSKVTHIWAITYAFGWYIYIQTCVFIMYMLQSVGFFQRWFRKIKTVKKLSELHLLTVKKGSEWRSKSIPHKRKSQEERIFLNVVIWNKRARVCDVRELPSLLVLLPPASSLLISLSLKYTCILDVPTHKRTSLMIFLNVVICNWSQNCGIKPFKMVFSINSITCFYHFLWKKLNDHSI